MPPDATAALVNQEEPGIYRVEEVMGIPEDIWKDMTA